MNEDNQKFEPIAWIEDEELLRDEGVIFGLSASEPDEKTAVIRHYFAVQMAVPEQMLLAGQEKFISLERQIVRKREEQQLAEAEIARYTEAMPVSSSHLLRTVFGTLVAAGACGFNFYLVHTILAPHFPQALFVSLGVFLAGMFSLFGKTSFFYQASAEKSPATWRQWIEEAGMPLAAALFTGVWAWQSYPPLIAAVLFVFVFALFLLSGKLLLSGLTLLKTESDTWVRERAFNRQRRRSLMTSDVDVSVLVVKIRDLEIEKNQINDQMAPFATQIAQLQARRDLLIKLFESEFYLSRNYKSRLTARQIEELTGNYKDKF